MRWSDQRRSATPGRPPSQTSNTSCRWLTPYLQQDPYRPPTPQPASVVATPPCSRKTLDDLDDLVTAVSLEATELDQFTDTLHDDALLRSPATVMPRPRWKSSRPLVTEDVQSPQHGVLVHAEDGCHVLGQGQALSGSSFSLGDGPANFRCHLIMEGAVSVRSTLTSNMVLGIVDLCEPDCQAPGDDCCDAAREAPSQMRRSFSSVRLANAVDGGGSSRQ